MGLWYLRDSEGTWLAEPRAAWPLLDPPPFEAKLEPLPGGPAL